jgi:transposase
MRKNREIIRLSCLGDLSQRQIAASCRVSPTTVSKVANAASAADLLRWPLPALTEVELRERLFGPAGAAVPSKPLPDLEELAKELSRRGVTMQLLWEEYRRDEPDGYGYTQFCKHLRQWQAAQDPTMRFEHVAGEKMFVDWAGQTIEYGPNGQKAYLFVAVLGASNYTFANVYGDMKMQSWIRAHVDALAFFGGVPRLIVPDNTRTAVSKACFYDPEVNRTYQELAEHYAMAVLPTRARKPRDKAKAEAAVQNAQRRVLAALRNAQFQSLGQLQQAVREKTDELNRRPFAKMQGNRRELYETLDKPALEALPDRPFSLGVWQEASVYKDYHIQVDKHFYSVPYTYVDKTVEVRVTDRTVEVYHEGVRLVTHRRSFLKGKATTLSEHRSEAHRATLEQDAAQFIAQASQVGPRCQEAVETIFGRVPHPEMAFRGCAGILRLNRRYGSKRLEAACERVLRTDTVRYTTIATMLKNGMEQQPVPQSGSHTPAIRHANVRGASYYGGKEAATC